MTRRARPDVRFTVRGKYRVVAERLRGAGGSLLDVGARDEVLKGYLEGVRYESADSGPGCRHRIDLERRLPFEDGAFDHVVALDVLEHLERIHGAFAELARVARRTLVIALPHMASWRHRVSFLVRGRLATGKYDLAEEPPGDRHRWFTILGETDRFVAGQARRRGWELVAIVREMEGGAAARMAGLALTALLPIERWTATRSLYFCEPQEPRVRP